MTILVDARPLMDMTAGGVPRLTRGLLPALFSAMPEHRFVLATSGSHRPTLPFSLPAHVTRRHIPLPNKLWSAGSFIGALSFDRWFRNEKPDVLLLPNVGFTGRLSVPYALIVHDLSFLIEPRWFSSKARWWHRAVRATRLIERATHLFVVSERTKQDLIERLDIPAEKISVIPPGLPTRLPFMELPDALAQRRFVTVMGAHDPRKNATCAVTAFQELVKDPAYQDVAFVLVGARASGSDLPASHFVSLKHPCDAAVNSLLKYASALLYPSWYEGFGLPLHEAARFNTPCIASTASCLPETTPHGTLFASPAKPQYWVEALKLVLDQPEKHKTQTDIGDWTRAATKIREELQKFKLFA